MNGHFSLDDFMDALASGEPTPGGGSAAALAGALGAALAAMVGRLTAGRKRYASVDQQMQAIINQADALRARLVSLAAADAGAYEAVRAAYRLPKESAEEQAVRQAAIQKAFKGASQTPLAVAEACLQVLDLLAQVAEAGNPNAATDAHVGALLTHAALQGAILNVRVNLTAIEDAAFTDDYEASAQRGLKEAAQIMTQIEESMARRA